METLNESPTADMASLAIWGRPCEFSLKHHSLGPIGAYSDRTVRTKARVNT